MMWGLRGALLGLRHKVEGLSLILDRILISIDIYNR